MKISFLLLCALCAVGAQAQRASVRGTVMDSTQAPLVSATIMLLNPTDSSLLNFAVSDAKGTFELKNGDVGNYLLKVTYVGLAPHYQKLALVAGNNDVRPITMLPLIQELSEVVIQGEKSPVTVKRDTIEFNAGSFKTKPNATVEDLIKKMPGIEVDNDGTIRAQGEQVQRVMVDGREFFGRDPKLATRNLPADAVDKVQVFDKKSDQAVFTGIDDGQKEKSINLELKEEKRHGAFGSLMAGAGTTDRFQGKASINRFEKENQWSLLGMGNNINEQGFSIDDYMNFSGNSQQMMGGGGVMRLQINGADSGIPLNLGNQQTGIVTNYAGGLNLNRNLGKNTKINGSYFYSDVGQNIVRSLHRVNYLPDSIYLFDQDSRQSSHVQSHRVNMSIDHKIDSANSVKFTLGGTFNNSTQDIQSSSATTTTDSQLQNKSDRYSSSLGNGFNLNSNLLYRHRFSKRGRSFSANFSLGLNDARVKGALESSNQFFLPTGELMKAIRQTNDQSNQNQSYGTTLTYTEPLGGRKYMEAGYAFSVNQNQVDRSVYNENNGVPVFNDTLSNKYNSDYFYQRPSLNFRLNRQKFNLVTGVAWQQTQLQGNLPLKDVVINRTFKNALPSLRFNYDFSNFKHFRIDYETSMQEPSIQQLQPVVDNSDPLNLSVGNPNLKPAYQHQATTHFTLFSPASFLSFFSFATLTYQTQAIAMSQSVDQNLIRTSRPVNVKDNLALDVDANVGFRLKSINSRINLGGNWKDNRGINLLNDLQNRYRQQTSGGSFRYNYSWKDVFSLDLGAEIDHQQTSYEFLTAHNQSYVNKTYSAELYFQFLKQFQLNSTFNYYVYHSQTTGFDQSIPLLNLYLSRFILKNKTGELKVGVNNLLDRSQRVVQSAGANYLQLEQVNNLGRYFMISFTYALNKQLNPMGGAGRPGFRMIRR